MFVEREEDGVWLREMPMWVVDTLLSVPEWVESDNPDVQKRLLPKAYEDPEQDKEWRDALGASLEHLFATRTQIVRGDLQKLQVVEPPDPAELDLPSTGDSELDEHRLAMQTLFNVWIPAAHVSAWVSTLTAGSHAIYILEGLTPEDVSHDLDVEKAHPDKQFSIMRLAILQEVLVRLLEDGMGD